MLVSRSKERICVREIREDTSQQILRNKKHEKKKQKSIKLHNLEPYSLTSTDRVITQQKKLVQSGVQLALE